MPARDPIVYVIWFIVALIIVATGLLFYFRWEIEKAEKDLRLVKPQLAKLGEHSGRISGLLKEIKQDKARGSNQAGGYIRSQATRYAQIREGAITLNPGQVEKNEAGGYEDLRYSVKVTRQNAVRREQILAWVYAIENETYGVKVTKLKLSPASREADDRWQVDMTVVQRDSLSSRPN